MLQKIFGEVFFIEYLQATASKTCKTDSSKFFYFEISFAIFKEEKEKLQNETDCLRKLLNVCIVKNTLEKVTKFCINRQCLPNRHLLVQSQK